MKKENTIKELSIDEIQAELKSRKDAKKAVKTELKKAAKKADKEAARLILQANIQGEIQRHLIDMKNVKVNGCNIKMTTPIHVKMVFGSELCQKDCDCFSTCESIVNLSGHKGQRKSNVEKVKLSTGKLTRIETKGQLSFQFDDGKIHLYKGKNWKETCDVARKELKELYPLTTGQKAAIGHKGKDCKFEKIFNGK